MIPLTTAVCQERKRKTNSWQSELANAIRTPEELLLMLGLTPDQVPGGIAAISDFPLRVPRGYVARMEPGNPRDPLLLQVLSRGLELVDQPGFHTDPVGDENAIVQPGILQKYHGRVLLITTGACPVHCRYCFRRHFPYSANHPGNDHWLEALDSIAADDSIREVILSGGDPLSLSTDRLSSLGRKLADIPHVKRLRIHTRMPIVLPGRINASLLEWLGKLPLQSVLVTHCNHARELDADVRAALTRLKQAGITLLNQAVLLRAVNDTADSQVALCEALFETGVMPYYLHMLDRVQGAAHFEVSQPRALEIMQAIQERLPGYLVPRLVKEVAGKSHKIPITDCR